MKQEKKGSRKRKKSIDKKKQKYLIPTYQALKKLLKSIDDYIQEQDRDFDDLDIEEQMSISDDYFYSQAIIGVAALNIRNTIVLFHYNKMIQEINKMEDPLKIKDFLNAILFIFNNDGKLQFTRIIVKRGTPTWLRKYNSFAEKMLIISRLRIKHQFAKINPKIAQLIENTKVFLTTPMAEIKEKFPLSTSQQIAWYASSIDIFAEKYSNLALDTYYDKLDYFEDIVTKLRNISLEYFIDAIRKDNAIFGEER